MAAAIWPLLQVAFKAEHRFCKEVERVGNSKVIILVPNLRIQSFSPCSAKMAPCCTCSVKAQGRLHLLLVILLLTPALLHCRPLLELSETADRIGWAKVSPLLAARVVGRENGSSEGGEEGVVMEGSMIGSRPPRCAGICRDCGRCEAVQVPLNPQLRTAGGAPPSAAINVRGDDSSNYKPLSWKCKCGDVIRNP